MNQRFLDQTYYEILEIRPNAPEDEIHRAYLKAKETYSPDSPALYTMFSPDEAQELSRLIEEAYAVLSNHAARKEYDSRLLGRAEVPEVQEEPSTAVVTPAPASETTMSYSSSSDENKVIPEGFAKTKHGVYEVNKEFENEISNSTQFDGEFIAKIRSYKNLSVEEISNETRVSRSYIRALEANDYETLPAEVFVRGFVLQYAKALGLDGNKVASSYMKKLRDARQ